MSMERRGQMDAEADALRRSQIAIRCAKSALLISSLKSWPDRCPKSEEEDEDSEKEDLMRAVVDLKTEVVRLRRRNRRTKLYCFMEVLLLISVLLFSWITSLVLLAFKFH